MVTLPNSISMVKSIDNHISKIEQRYGLPKSPLEIINKSGHYFSSRMVLTGDYSKIIFNKLNKLLPTYQSFYDKETKSLVREVFKKILRYTDIRIPAFRLVDYPKNQGYCCSERGIENRQLAIKRREGTCCGVK